MLRLRKMECGMPLARYFLYVGGALLALLFVFDPYLPKLPAAAFGKSPSTTIHIHSDHKWPERIVYDTSLSTVIPTQIANIEDNIAVSEIVAATSDREAFAHMQPSRKLSDAKKIEPKLQRQHKIAKRRIAAPSRPAARQMAFGWFGERIW
jgi:hypothetical protein